MLAETPGRGQERRTTRPAAAEAPELGYGFYRDVFLKYLLPLIHSNKYETWTTRQRTEQNFDPSSLSALTPLAAWSSGLRALDTNADFTQTTQPQPSQRRKKKMDAF